MKAKKIILSLMFLLLPIFSTASAEVDEWGINHTYVREDGVEFEYCDMGYGQRMKGVSMSDIIANDSHSNITYMKFECVWQGHPDDSDFNETFENNYTEDNIFSPGTWISYSGAQSLAIENNKNPLPTSGNYRCRLTIDLANGRHFVSNWERRYDTNFAIRDNGIVAIHEYDKTDHRCPEVNWDKYFQNVQRIVY